MKIENIAFVSCSKNNKKTLLEESVEKIPGHTELYTFKDNTKSICEVYNEFINNNGGYYQEDTAVVFVHDDVYINCQDLHEKIDRAFKSYDVIGVAGTLNAQIKEPCLWHVMGNRQDHRGAAAHPITRDGSLEPYHITSFGPMPSRALLIDGVFIAVKPNVLKKVQFDASNPARFHYYDLDFSLECNKNQYKIGVWDIPIIHMSPGLTNPDEEWRRGQDWFLTKWG